MHENSTKEAPRRDVAECGAWPCQSASIGLEERPDASQSMVASSSLHGERMARSSQSPTGQGQRPNDIPANVAGVRPSGSGIGRHEGKPCHEKRLAPVGNPSSKHQESLRPQAEAQLVNAATPHGQVSTENVLQLLEHQQYRCALTGRRLTPQTAALDHIVPIRRDGQHVIENTQVLHKDVNRAKGSLTSEEFIGLCREVVRWSDSPIARKDLQ